MTVDKSAASFLLRNWQEICILFLNILLERKLTSLSPVGDIFKIYEYQKDTGNLPHIHMMLLIKWDYLSEYQI